MSLQKLVEEFHVKHGFDKDKKIVKPELEGAVAVVETGVNALLEHCATAISTTAEMLDEHMKHLASHGIHDPRVVRAQLMTEELGETIKAMGKYDALETIDGLADLLYVTLGSGVAFGLDVEEAMRRVHASNMTKQGDGTKRLRDKGDSYEPPKLDDLV